MIDLFHASTPNGQEITLDNYPTVNNGCQHIRAQCGSIRAQANAQQISMAAIFSLCMMRLLLLREACNVTTRRHYSD